MTDLSKIQPVHRQRAACVYIRQSTPHQMEHNRESTARQYALVCPFPTNQQTSTLLPSRYPSHRI